MWRDRMLRHFRLRATALLLVAVCAAAAGAAPAPTEFSTDLATRTFDLPAEVKALIKG